MGRSTIPVGCSRPNGTVSASSPWPVPARRDSIRVAATTSRRNIPPSVPRSPPSAATRCSTARSWRSIAPAARAFNCCRMPVATPRACFIACSTCSIATATTCASKACSSARRNSQTSCRSPRCCSTASMSPAPASRPSRRRIAPAKKASWRSSRADAITPANARANG